MALSSEEFPIIDKEYGEALEPGPVHISNKAVEKMQRAIGNASIPLVRKEMDRKRLVRMREVPVPSTSEYFKQINQ